MLRGYLAISAERGIPLLVLSLNTGSLQFDTGRRRTRVRNNTNSRSRYSSNVLQRKIKKLQAVLVTVQLYINKKSSFN